MVIKKIMIEVKKRKFKKLMVSILVDTPNNFIFFSVFSINLLLYIFLDNSVFFILHLNFHTTYVLPPWQRNVFPSPRR